MNAVEAAPPELSHLPNRLCPRILGDGAMARLMREHDWSTSCLGELASWPESLLTAVNLVLASPIATSLYWGPQHVLLYNDNYRAFMGARHPASLGQPGAVVWKEAWHIVGPQIEQTFATGEVFRGESALVPIEQDGQMVDHYWDYSLSPVHDSKRGEIAGVYNPCVNATASFINEGERNRLSERLRQVMESTSDGVVSIDRDWRFTYMNENARRAAHPIENLIGRNIWEALPGLVYEGSPNVYHYHRAMDENEPGEFESYYPAPLNHWLHVQVRPATDGIVLFFRDITEQKLSAAALEKAAADLAASEEELRWTIALSSQQTWTADPRGSITKNTGDLTMLTGHTTDRMLGDQWPAAMHPDDAALMIDAWSRSVRTGEPYDIEHRMSTTTGGYHWFRSRAFSRCDAQGRIVKWYGITDDIDERKRDIEIMQHNAAALAASEEELRWTVKMSTQNPWTADADGKLLTGGDILLEHPGRPSEVLLDKYWTECIHPEDRPKVDAVWRYSLLTGDPFDMEHRLRTATGEFHWLRARAYPRRDADGKIVKWYGTTEDIHARKQAEQALRTTEKLAAVGRLATSIAHEINNPLEAVTNLLYLARTSEELDEVLGYIRSAEQELHRASVITNQTLRFQRQSTAPIALSSEDLVENCLGVFQGKLQNSAVVPEKRLRATRAVICYDGEIRQVFLNLVGNAIDAMQPGGGRLLIRTREGAHPATGKRGLILTVADTGSGISPEAQKRIFEPFFTTKGLGGTGLGLWVSLEIVARHQGSLRVRSRPRRRRTDLDDHGQRAGGTVFTLFLPFDAAARPTAPVEVPRELDSVAA